MRRAIVLIGVALALAGGLGWLFQDQILLTLIGIAAQRRMPVGPNQPVVWDRGPSPPRRAPGERPPNIVVIMADDLGWNDLSFGGGGVAGGSVPTPHIDSLARDGVRFSAGYSGQRHLRALARGDLMSGRYGTRFGFEFTPTPPGMSRIVPRLANAMPGRLRPSRPPRGRGAADFDAMGMPASEITLAELLKRRGYHTVHIGKWHLGGENGMAPHEQGFDESLLMASGLYLPVDDPNVVNSRQDFDPIDRFLWRALKHAASFNGGAAFEPAGYLTDYYTDEAVKVIEANADRPFFLYLAHWAPHTPLQATRADYDALSHIADHRLRVYAAMIRALDRGVGRVLDALRANGLEENTLVFFTSDNGAPGYIGLPDVNRPFRGWKITLLRGRHPRALLRAVARAARGRTVVRRAGARLRHLRHGRGGRGCAAAGGPHDRRRRPRALRARRARGRAASRRCSGARATTRRRAIDGWKLQVNERPPGTTWLFDLRADPDRADQPGRARARARRGAAPRARGAQRRAGRVGLAVADGVADQRRQDARRARRARRRVHLLAELSGHPADLERLHQIVVVDSDPEQ